MDQLQPLICGNLNLKTSYIFTKRELFYIKGYDFNNTWLVKCFQFLFDTSDCSNLKVWTWEGVCHVNHPHTGVGGATGRKHHLRVCVLAVCLTPLMRFSGPAVLHRWQQICPASTWSLKRKMRCYLHAFLLCILFTFLSLLYVFSQLTSTSVDGEDWGLNERGLPGRSSHDTGGVLRKKPGLAGHRDREGPDR